MCKLEKTNYNKIDSCSALKRLKIIKLENAYTYFLSCLAKVVYIYTRILK